MIRWTAPDDGGSAITEYRIIAYRFVGSRRVEQATFVGIDPTASRVALQLSPGTWGIKVRAVNAIGKGPLSPLSNKVAAR